MSYVLLTAARDEERFIASTIESVLAQTVLPAKWVIASDGSSDGTNHILRSYAARHTFLHWVYVEPGPARGVVAKIGALRCAFKALGGVDYDFIGNLDADILLAPSYYEVLLEQFHKVPSLGIGGGMVHEKSGTGYKTRRSNNARSVAHGAQIMRRECYEELGGYLPVKYGGEDWCAEVSARMRGWRVDAFPELKVMHQRLTGAADRILEHRFRQGRMDYSFGSDPAFEVVKCGRRILEKPHMAGALARMAGYLWSWFRREDVLVPKDVANFVRSEQQQRLKSWIMRIASLGRDGMPG